MATNPHKSINEPDTPALPLPTTPSINEPKDPPPKPVITALDPATCEIGGEDFTLDIEGEGFLPTSIIRFAGHDEPTTFNEDGSLSTGVKPSLWANPVVVDCIVRNGVAVSDPWPFEFTAPAGRAGKRNAHDDD